MTETAKNTTEEEMQNASPAEQVAAEEAAQEDVAQDQADAAGSADDVIAALQAENAELKDRLLRTAAEAENIRRRAKKDVEDSANYAITKFARDLLDVGDNLRRALEAAGDGSQQNEAMKTLIEGVEMTERTLLKSFEQNGIEKMEPLGEKLDPNKHQAVFEMPSAEHPEGHVAQVMQAGYVLKGRLLRPAMVGVAKGAAPDTSAEPGSNVDTSA
ncbi:nucleotide exchange factor GrpE [Thalassospira marina]|uniref:Protein GrpE n=1 Tax=Thalassospira marina TaxID=2048283 RepID=A0ABN5FJW0_9PROT|nr:nucleotide exchange factor GrpE [Thalassospira marina]AUG54623.1 nucleotide exchange factor GrpE [Thalassospira marina]